jgi:membrane protease YdiL (CAAX protease family)
MGKGRVDKKGILIAIVFSLIITAVFLLIEIFTKDCFMSKGYTRFYLLDAVVRFLFWIVAAIVLFVFLKKPFSKTFAARIPKSAWLMLIPVYVYFLSYFTLIGVIESVSAYTISFLACAVQQLATGLFEETVYRGIVMKPFEKYYSDRKWRIVAIVTSGLVFGLSHMFNFLFTGDILGTARQALFTVIWGMFIAAIYMISDNLLLVIIIHTVWDIWIRIPQFYFNMAEKATVLYSIGEILRFIIHPFVLGIMAVLIAMYAKTLKQNKKDND